LHFIEAGFTPVLATTCFSYLEEFCHTCGWHLTEDGSEGVCYRNSKEQCSVNVDTTIRADQKAFFAETGKLPENVIVPGSNIEADAMMSPMAGVYLMSDPIDRAQTKFA